MLRKKIIFSLFCFIVFLLALEIFLRLAGFISLFAQERKNVSLLREKNTCRVLCIGESTTAWGGESSYPATLERLLKNSTGDLKFSVINKGLPGTTSSYILYKFEENLDLYKPDIVIVMMGINDRMPHIYKNKLPDSAPGNFLLSLRVFTLSRMIWYSILNKVQHWGLDLVYTKPVDIWLSKDTFDYSNMVGSPFIKSAWFFKDQGSYGLAEESFKMAIENDRDKDLAFVELAHLYREEERYNEAQKVLMDGLAYNPKSRDAYVGLGCLYQDKKMFLLAEEMLKKGITIDPGYVLFYLGLGFVYQEQDKYLEAERMFNEVMKIDPRNILAYQGLGGIYLERNDLLAAEKIFQKAVAIKPDDKSYSGLAFVYRKQGKIALADKYLLKAEKLRLLNYNFLTRENYIKMKRILDKRGILMFCMQYPMQSIEPIKAIFRGEAGVYFIDNEHSFKEALKQGSYKEYFTDNFGGDFGHCTSRGNYLIAENAAKAIIRVCVKKKQE